MNEVYLSISNEINRIVGKVENQITMIGIVGCPGSGKSTTSLTLKNLIPNLEIIPMDGFHYYRSELDKFDDPVEAHARRGAHHTFNSEKFIDSLLLLKKNGSGTFPSFDHKIGDPIEEDIIVCSAKHKVIIVEGNYLLLDLEPWIKLRNILDYIFFIDAGDAMIRSRVVNRHMSTGLSHEAAVFRFETNDLLNALVILGTKHRADKIYQSVDEM